MGLFVVGLIGIGVADIAGDQAAMLVRHRFRDRQGIAVERLQDVLAADDPQLLSVALIGECLDDVRPGMDEVLMQTAHDLRMIDDDLGHESAGLQIAPPLELEQIAFRADDRAFGEALQQAALFTCHDCISHRVYGHDAGTAVGFEDGVGRRKPRRPCYPLS
jgi:hypothetical protein